MGNDERKIIGAVQESIADTVTTFRENELYFLNEFDVQAFLTNKIKEKLGDNPNGKFNKTSSLVHCQVGVYGGESGRYIPDIVIMQPNSFKLIGKGDTPPWEATSFCNVEIKFNLVGSKKDVMSGIKSDYNKIVEKVSPISYVVYLDYRNHLTSNDVENVANLLGIKTTTGNYNLSICYASRKDGFVITSLIKN